MLVAARSRAAVRLFASLAISLCLSAVAHPQTPTATSSSDGFSFEQLYELAARDNLQITVVLRPGSRNVCNDDRWRSRCVQIFCDLRGYLMGQTGAVG